MTPSAVTIQITPKSVPSTPSWMGEVGAVAQVLSHAGILKAFRNTYGLPERALATTISSILPWRSLATRLVVNPPSKPFMSDSCPLPKSSWRSLVAIACPLALRSRAFLLPLIRQPWRRCGRSFKKISWHASLSTLQEACGIVSASIGS